MSKLADGRPLLPESREGLPVASWATRRGARRHRPWPIFVLALLSFFVLGTHIHLTRPGANRTVHIPVDAAATHARCQNLKMKPGPPPTFNNRSTSDRYVAGTRPVFIKNATIWTGRINGLEIIKGDILLRNGLIKAFGHVPKTLVDNLEGDATVIDAKGSWVSPGIVDLHSHLGVDSAPELDGSEDYNSRHGTVQPWLRALDGLNTHDDAYHLSIAGGVTTALVLPGSGNGIGGQGFVIKLRDTAERSPTSKLLEPPFTINQSSTIDLSLPPRWRQMKHACGENQRGWPYENTRMDNVWALREIYDKAWQIKQKQDEYCEKALANDWEGLGAFPDELKWEALVDVLRGRVKVQVHCYEAVDLDGIVRLTNEFKFPIAAFHHAHETYLVPDLLKKAWGNVPASAIFATNARYKREAYRGSEFAARILADNGLPVVMKSDHPVLNSRYLLYEAQQAHYYGLPDNLALAAVTSTPAQVMGMEHRIGFIKEGYDADLVIWDSHPLALGATPKQVFIDGIPQLQSPVSVEKPKTFQKVPKTPDFDKEAADAVKYEGLPPLEPIKSVQGTVVFINVKSLTTRGRAGAKSVQSMITESGEPGVVVVHEGKVVCAGAEENCASFLSESDETVDLQGGAISPGLVSFGSPLGLEEIEAESSTSDGYVYDPFSKGTPEIAGGDTALIQAVDGLTFATRDAYLAYRSGVTVGITAPKHRGFLAGLSTAFGLGVAHKLRPGAIVQEIAAVHVTVSRFGRTPSVSTQIATLRRLLLESGEGEIGKWFGRVAKGEVTLVIEAQSADIIASIIALKKEVENKTGVPIKLTISRATEAHLLAKEIAEADIGIVVVPSRPFPYDWQSRRILPGPPLTRDSAISLLLSHNVTVGVGIEEPWSARNTRFDVAWAALEVYGELNQSEALALASTNLEKLLGLELEAEHADLVAVQGGDLFDFESKVVGILSPRRDVVDLF